MHGIFPRYKGKFEALLSTHYAAAVDPARPRAHAHAVRARALRRSEAAQVRGGAGRGEADPALTGVQAIVEAEMADGSKLAVRCEHPRGSPENPLTRAQIEDKFRTYAKGGCLPRRSTEVIARSAAGGPQVGSPTDGTPAAASAREERASAA